MKPAPAALSPTRFFCGRTLPGIIGSSEKPIHRANAAPTQTSKTVQRAQAESDLLKREVINGRKCLLHLRSEHIKRDYSYTLCRKNCKKFFPAHDIILPKLSFFDNYTIHAKLSFVNNFSRY